MEEAHGWLTIYKDVAAAGFPAAMFMALITGYLRVWLWHKAHVEVVTTIVNGYEVRLKEWQERYAQALLEKDEWKQFTKARLTSLEERAREIERPSRHSSRRDE